ncbi:MAG TPA: hypothetical protein VMX35_04255 [Acidobacteriota bacterium]|nr:hypothetical protein [Acidobacteriota bacterium]
MRAAVGIALLLSLALPALAQEEENTLRDARVGEWALYSASGSMQERHSVVARRREVVVVRVDSIINGKVISSNTVNYRVNTPQFLAGAEGQQQVRAGGRLYDCVVVRRGNRLFYYSNDVPVTGLVAVSRGGNSIQEIIDYGF